tara:strand:- start:134 stop:292 length:159 start_codon:yes stop_codon:yes gene_type:complete
MIYIKLSSQHVIRIDQSSVFIVKHLIPISQSAAVMEGEPLAKYFPTVTKESK